MENFRTLKILKIIIMGTLALSPIFSSAYEPETTHKALTQEIIKNFNAYYPKLKLGAIESAAVEVGSIGEDDGVRALHHFYDPVYNRGLFGQLSAKNWAQNTLAQAGAFRPLAGAITGIFGAPTDYSWDRAVYDYVWADKSRGLDGLGHILHLIEDMSVPDHTRNDAHPPYGDKLFHQASPYEHWADKWNTETISGLSTMIYHSDSQPAHFSSLAGYFDSIASYSNNNFFSKDTTPDKSQIYFQPLEGKTIKQTLSTGDVAEFILSVGLDKYKLAKIKTNIITVSRLYFIEYQDKLVLTDYWSHLSKQAVLHGTGVVRLFFEEVEKERKEKKLFAKNKSVLDRLASVVGISQPEPTPLVSEIPDNAFQINLAVKPPSEEIVGAKSDLDVGRLSEISRSSTLGVSPGGVEEENHSNILENVGMSQVGGNTESGSLPPFLQLQAIGGGSAGFGGGGSPTPSVQILTTSSEVQSLGGTETSEPPDTTPPDISLSVSECSSSLSSDGCLLASSTVSLVWSSTANDLNHYIIECEKSSPPVGGCSGFNFASTTATSTIYSLPTDDSIYIFKAKAVDGAGNESAQTTKTAELSLRPVVINEVAWAGTSAPFANDEWIELYNRSSQSVNLANWVLYASDGVPYVNLSGVIFAGGYYLIERTDDNTVSDVAADLVTPFSGSGAGSGLENSVEILVLSHASTTIDQTVLCSNNWGGGSVSGVYPTMERIDPDVAGTDSTNWGTSNSGASNGFIKNGKDSAGAALTATPRARNSLHYLISQGSTLSADRVLKKSWGVYIIGPSENFTVSAGKTLTVGPGVTIKMGDSANLIVDGTLKSDGTAEDNILFTRLSAAGGWRNVRITSNSQNSSVSYTRFKYGGGFTSNIPSERRALFSVIDNSITISNSIFENSFSAGMRLTTSTSAVQNSTFSVGTSTADNVGLYIVGGSPIISGNTFSENYFGAKMEGAAASYANNVFNNNISYALSSSNGSSTFSGNSGAGNGKNGIALLGTISAAGGTTTLASNPLPYIATSLSYAQIAVGSVLVLEAGARFAGEDVFSRLNVNGSLKLEGANKDSIIFTSLADTAPAQWYGIAVNSGGYMYGGGFTLRYGGRGMGDNPNAIAGIGIFGGSVNLSDGRIENNYQAGMRLYDSSTSTLSNFEFLNHQMPTGNSTAFISANSTIQATNVTFSGNTTDKSPANAF